MSESADYEPAPWARGHDFASARAAYDVHAGRSYAKAINQGVTADQLVPESITTNSPTPMLVRCDVTGSMGGWPDTIFSKLPYMDHEIRTEYLGEEAETSFGAISDTGDDYPLQVQGFAKGKGMADSLERLVITKGGAGPGTICEAYAVSALYDCRNVRMPKSIIKPPLIVIGDEKPYDLVSVNDAQNFAKVGIKSGMNANQIYHELMDRFEVYLILKPYMDETLKGDKLSGYTKEVHERWEEILGANRIALLSEAGRVVDVMFGLLAQFAGKVDYFKKELEGRQKPKQVETVYRSLATVHALPAAKSIKKLPQGTSILHRTGKGGKNVDPLI